MPSLPVLEGEMKVCEEDKGTGIRWKEERRTEEGVLEGEGTELRSSREGRQTLLKRWQDGMGCRDEVAVFSL